MKKSLEGQVIIHQRILVIPDFSIEQSEIKSIRPNNLLEIVAVHEHRRRLGFASNGLCH